METTNLSIVQLSKEELVNTVKQAVSEALGDTNPINSKDKSLGKYISLKDAMEKLGRKNTWFHNKRKSGELPAIKSGNLWWYKVEDLEKFIDSGIES